MAITLGRSGSLSPGFGTDIISVTKTEEAETIDVSNRSNSSGGYRVFEAGFTSETFEVECHDATGVISELENSSGGSGFTVMGVSENIGIDGAVTFTITLRSLG
jgi:hypothetical protein